MSETKEGLRNRLKNVLGQLSEAEFKTLSSQIQHHVEAFFKEFESPVTIVGYVAFQYEAVIPMEQYLTHNWLLPTFNTQLKAYEFAPLEAGKPLQKGLFGIDEPVGRSDQMSIYDARESVDIWLVPGVVFDKQGNRIGRGKGFYDQFLKEASGLKVGICYECQLVETVPAESQDIAMDMIITEKGIYRFSH